MIDLLEPEVPLAAARGLAKVYETPSGGIEALHDVDAQFRAGEITAVVGASGSGKSTLLRALGGLDRPTSGSLLVGLVTVPRDTDDGGSNHPNR